MPSYQHVFTPAAADEYEQAYLWYKAKSIVAGDRLLLEAEQTIEKICTTPTRYRNTYKSLREVSLKKFPYSIIYLLDKPKATVVIVAFFHHKRNPRKKYRP